MLSMVTPIEKSGSPIGRFMADRGQAVHPRDLLEVRNGISDFKREWFTSLDSVDCGAN